MSRRHSAFQRLDSTVVGVGAELDDGLALMNGQIATVTAIDATPKISHASADRALILMRTTQAPPAMAIPVPTPAKTMPLRPERPSSARRSSTQAETNISTQALAIPAT